MFENMHKTGSIATRSMGNGSYPKSGELIEDKSPGEGSPAGKIQDMTVPKSHCHHHRPPRLFKGSPESRRRSVKMIHKRPMLNKAVTKL